jgi:hypothetical protein
MKLGASDFGKDTFYWTIKEDLAVEDVSDQEENLQGKQV